MEDGRSLNEHRLQGLKLVDNDKQLGCNAQALSEQLINKCIVSNEFSMTIQCLHYIKLNLFTDVQTPKEEKVEKERLSCFSF